MVNTAVTTESLVLENPRENERFSRGTDLAKASQRAPAQCFHCGNDCADDPFDFGGRVFCCSGCKTVFELITENGLGEFYDLERSGIRAREGNPALKFAFVDDAPVRERLVDFSNENLTRITLRLPAIHCIACVWLLENLHRLRAGIGHAQVNFPRKELALAFQTKEVRLSEVIGLLSSLGYEPDLRLSDLEARPAPPIRRRLWLQLGLAGFAFGNTMLFSIASYIGLDSASGPGFRRLVGIISLVLSIPVLTYSAREYWVSAWASLRRKLLNIDVPIAAGIAALFGQSAYEVLSGRGEGYFDSMAGLLFFLLCGRLFQQKTFDRLAFDRDYRSFFPLSVTRCDLNGVETAAALSELRPGDRLAIRNGELIPADARLLSGRGLIDYSFVTGESEPVAKQGGEYLYAGGRQRGETIHVRTVKPVSQSYLTSLWNQDVFRKASPADTLDVITNRYSQRFTKLVLALALGAALFWAFVRPTVAVTAFTSVLIVACPCALALAVPFTFGFAQRFLARRDVFLKSTAVLERLAAATSLVFDKTGTLTTATGRVSFHGTPLANDEIRWIASLAEHSTHPYARRLCAALATGAATLPTSGFVEVAGAGVIGCVAGRRIHLGSAQWVGARPAAALSPFAKGSTIHLAIDGTYRGCFQIENALRENTEDMISSLGGEYELALLSGDHDGERDQFQALLGPAATLRFNQSPLDKLEFVRQAQKAGRAVVMIGDGLNDAGALKQSDVGIAVVEEMSAFSPASDAIIRANMIPHLGAVAQFARAAVRVVYICFAVSSVYNVIGVSIAARGLLSPVVCAVLMPLSSVTVVGLACLATAWAGNRLLPGVAAAGTSSQLAHERSLSA